MGQEAQPEGSGHTWLQDLLPGSLLWLRSLAFMGHINVLYLSRVGDLKSWRGDTAVSFGT